MQLQLKIGCTVSTVCSLSVGNSQSDYDDVVHAFYAFWQSYFTRKPYYWVDKYDLRDAPNRRVQRLMEKENKKLRDAAKKQRNETVKVYFSHSGITIP